MSDPSSGDVPDPFKGMPLFGDLAKLLGQQAADPWVAAAQVAQMAATDGEPEANVDPAGRVQLAELARVAELHVGAVTGLELASEGRPLRVQAVTRGQWATDTLQAWRPRFERLGRQLSQAGPPEPGDPFGPLMAMMGPMLLALGAASMVGHLGRRVLGSYDLPLPRPTDSPVPIVLPNVDAFATDWSLPPDDVRLWVCLHEITHHAVLNVAHVRSALDELLDEYLAGFQADGPVAGGAFDDLDPSDPEAMAKAFGDPLALPGTVRSPAQEALLPRLEALTCAVVGYVDTCMDDIGHGLIATYPRLTEALRRRRVEAGTHDRFIEQLLGLELSQTAYDRGEAFVEGIVERAGNDGRARLWSSPATLPTPAEVDAPGLWLARIDLPLD